MIKEQLELIDKINLLRPRKMKGTFSPEPPNLELFILLKNLELLGTAPLLQEIERLRKIIQIEGNKKISNLNELEINHLTKKVDEFRA